MDQQLSYAEIFKTISKQVSLRKGNLSKRALMVGLPLIVPFVFLVNADDLLPKVISESAESLYYIVVSVFIGLGLLWAGVTSRIFRVERAIWIDSYFDGVNLTGKQSWKIASKLFWSNVALSLNVFLRYYLWLLVLWIFLIVGFSFLLRADAITFSVWWYMGIVVGIPTSFLVYSFYVKIRLRYLIFSFLDLYGTPEFSYRAVFKGAVAINKVTKGDSFQKTLVIMFGSEVVEFLATSAVNSSMRWSVSRMGGVGKAAGDVAGFATSQVAVALRSYTQDITYYAYYRAGRSLLYGGVNQAVNYQVYRLGQEK